jgi:hypothetical protein
MLSPFSDKENRGNHLDDADRRRKNIEANSKSDAAGASHRGPATSNPLAPFNVHRDLLFGIAHRMLGSRADAEDMLQETYLRWQQASECWHDVRIRVSVQARIMT